jgi:hypothetical protein
MKRDMAIIREILLDLEAKDDGLKLTAEHAYNALLMIDAGLIEGTAAGWPSSKVVYAIRLTWQGHELLDAMRDDTVWKKAQETILKPAGGFMLDVVLAWGKAEMSSRLGINL